MDEHNSEEARWRLSRYAPPEGGDAQLNHQVTTSNAAPTVQPAGAAGEWTGDTVISFWQPDGTFNSFYKAVADAHNAALAAERERVAFLQKNMADPCFEKGCQFAAEREKVQE